MVLKLEICTLPRWRVFLTVVVRLPFVLAPEIATLPQGRAPQAPARGGGVPCPHSGPGHPSHPSFVFAISQLQYRCSSVSFNER